MVEAFLILSLGLFFIMAVIFLKSEKKVKKLDSIYVVHYTVVVGDQVSNLDFERDSYEQASLLLDELIEQLGGQGEIETVVK